MMLGVCLSLPTPNAPKTRNFQAIIDSGASRCIFNASLAPELGLKLEDGDLQGAQGIGGSSQVWVHEVCIYVPDGDPVTTLVPSRKTFRPPACSVWLASLNISLLLLTPEFSTLSSSASCRIRRSAYFFFAQRNF
jgi:hypothetical protein